MKQKLVNVTRRLLPAGPLRGVEEAYRQSRVKMVSARYGYPARSLKVIAITGTNGKTTTACFINEILKEAGKKTALFTTAVIEVDGTARANDMNMTVASTKIMQQFFVEAKQAKVDYVVLEITSHALHQHKLDGVPIEAAIMTNLTQDHLDYHKTMEEYATAKGKLFTLNPQFIVLNRDDEWFDFFDKYSASSAKMTYGQNPEAEARIEKVTLYKKGTEVALTIDHQTKLELATALPGEFNAYNAAAAATLAYLLGVDLDAIVEGVANLEEVPGRFQRVIEKDPYDVIVDYAHTPDALDKLLTAVKTLTKNRVILVFGACGDRDKSKRPIMGEVAARLADRIFVTDEESYNENPQAIRTMIIDGIETAKAEAKMTEIADRKAAIEKAMSIATKGDTVVITGMGHEQFRIINGNRVPWNDADVVRALHAK